MQMPKLAMVMTIAATLASGALASGALAAPDAPAAGEKVVQQMSGTGLGRPRPFHVDGPWELRWTASQLFQVMAYRDGDDMPEILANQMGPGSGTSYVPKGGTYRLVFNCTGKWSATAIRLPD